MLTSGFYLLENPSYCRSKSYLAGIGNFALFCSCDLDLDPVTFIYELDLYSLKMYQQTKNH